MHIKRPDRTPTQQLLAALALLVAFNGALTSQARADTQECTMVSDVSVGGVTLKRGDLIYNRWSNDVGLSFHIISRGQFQEVEGIEANLVDCLGSNKGIAEYPVVLTDVEGRTLLAKEFGILFDPKTADPNRSTLNILPNKCFYIGDGHVGMELTNGFYEDYRKKGFTLDTLCLTLTSGQIRFNPETGDRLPTYVFVDNGNFISNELPLEVPSCFSKGKTSVNPKGFGATMKPIGCDVKYHPWSGRKLSKEEEQFFTVHASLRASGDAGSANEDSQQLAADPNRRLSSARIEAIKQNVKPSK